MSVGSEIARRKEGACLRVCWLSGDYELSCSADCEYQNFCCQLTNVIYLLNKMRSTIIVIALLGIFENQLGFIGANEYDLHLCMNNRTVTTKIIDSQDSYSCSCKVGPYEGPVIRDDYVHMPGIGSHKLHTEAKSWNDARKICNEEGGHLAVINSREEETILLNMLNASRNNITNATNTEVAFLGIHDFFKEGEWLTIFGHSIHSTGYANWSATYWGGQPDNKNKNQNCGALIYEGGLDDVFCHESYAFFCELPLSCT
ncbi:hemolymph lipopolysaccharide-binding protein isoform X2 [Nasonia vitripennis]|uniref:C-type lectin domain-containing protein n=1 Tax=Nasonia vitripennis TaxID=7425 RepID=A0A7M7G1D6_NASVI|nr:hemolymph lipopolysaccharide-binding protein isoform X2 [Nasonia vitripennis]